MPDELEIKHRNLPHWTREGSIYFITFRLAEGELSAKERQLAFSHIRAGDDRFYRLFGTVVMPDHVHLLITLQGGYDLPRVMKGTNWVTARLIDEDRGRRGAVWQDESYDRIVRDRAEFIEKQNYILNNPVKKGLVERPEDYAWLYLPD